MTDSQSISDFSERAYLNYAMYVITDRALPHIADGLKPVQRRIIYAMSELGLGATTKPKKSARTVGDVLGKYHPHGDSACYEAMVLMAQPFSYRYPLIVGQGNWGSSDDPKSFAAMRYTEAKMSAYAETLLGELDRATGDWQDNFDGSLKEPVTLPARLPNILLNGTTGIAVGMATDIPPHNLDEVVAGCIALLKDPNLSLDALVKIIPAPDLPTTAQIITSPSELATIYATGKGSYKTQATYQLDPKDKHSIIITALPYQVSGNKVIEQIAKLMMDKKSPIGSLIADINDESDHENPCRIVLTLKKSKTCPTALMGYLYGATDLQTSHRVNLNMIGSDGKPAVKDLKTLLSEWLAIRKRVVTDRLTHRLSQITDRLHIVAGLLIAYVHIDDIIAIIRGEDKPKAILMARFGLSDTQAVAILDIKLRQLAKLEELALTQESNDLQAQKDELYATLSSPEKLDALIIKELKADAKRYGDPRRSPIVTQTQMPTLDDKLISDDPITVVISQAGWIRAAKGYDIDPTTMNYRTGDGYLHHLPAKSSDAIILLDSDGRSYQLDAHILPSARGLGEPLTSFLRPAAGASFVYATTKQKGNVVLARTDGYGFIADIEGLATNQKAGKAVVNLEDNTLLATAIAKTDTHLAILSSGGRLLVCPLNELPTLKKGKGNKLTDLDGDKVLSIITLTLGDTLLASTGKQTKAVDIADYVSVRGRRGKPLPKALQKAVAISKKTNQ